MFRLASEVGEPLLKKFKVRSLIVSMLFGHIVERTGMKV